MANRGGVGAGRVRAGGGVEAEAEDAAVSRRLFEKECDNFQVTGRRSRDASSAPPHRTPARAPPHHGPCRSRAPTPTLLRTPCAAPHAACAAQPQH